MAIPRLCLKERRRDRSVLRADSHTIVFNTVSLDVIIISLLVFKAGIWT